MSADTHSPAELQREIEADRQRIEDKLHTIQERMSPGELMDELFAYARRSGGAEFLTNLAGAMKANPIPVALTGIGLAWLLADPASRAPHASAPIMVSTTIHSRPSKATCGVLARSRRILASGTATSKTKVAVAFEPAPMPLAAGPVISSIPVAPSTVASPTLPDGRSRISVMKQASCSMKPPAGRRQRGER